jgi:hypothetical protein
MGMKNDRPSGLVVPEGGPILAWPLRGVPGQAGVQRWEAFGVGG